MRVRGICAACVGVVGFLSVVAEPSYGMLALSQGKTSCKPTAYPGSSLYQYQLNCDPTGVYRFRMTFGYEANHFDITGVDFLAGYMPDPTYYGALIPATVPLFNPTLQESIDQENLQNDGFFEVYGVWGGTGNPPEYELDMFGVRVQQVVPPIILSSVDGPFAAAVVLPDPDLDHTFTYGWGERGDFMTRADGVTFLGAFDEQTNPTGIVRSSYTGSANDIALETAVPLPSVAWGGMALCGMLGLRRSRRAAGVSA